MQYFLWLRDLAKGDLGVSLYSQDSVLSEIARRWTVTLEVGGLALLLSTLTAVPVGVVSALKQDTCIDHLLRGFSVLLIAVPTFWAAILAVLLPSQFFNWTPVKVWTPFTEDPLLNLRLVLIPAAVLGLFTGGLVMRLTRAQMLEVMRNDYIRTARAKGLAERVIIVRHALKNALIPVVTVIGGQIGFLIGGSVIVEQVFALPGVGRYLFSSIGARDYPVVQGVTLLLTTSIVLINLVVDLTYSYLDPRIRYQ
ncbi:MAG: ABC transporter permease [Chloroflexi bacterium]|nr:ABC transporter permease [Chloroflexota bacterium]